MFVLTRRMKERSRDNSDYWEEDDFEEDDYDDSEVEDIAEKSSETVSVDKSTNESTKESNVELREKLAEEARRTGVMQAAPGTEQGKTGWYIDSGGELTSWLVSESGEWTRMS